MRPAFPASDYYGPSAPSRRRQPTASLPTTAQGRKGGRHRDSSHVHHVSIDGIGAQLFPLQHRHEYAAVLPRGLTTDHITSASESPPTTTAGGVRCDPAHIHQIRAGVTLKGVQPLVHSRYTFRLAKRALDRPVVPVRLAVVGAAPTLTRASEIKLPPASTRLLRQPDAGALSSPLDSWRLVAHNALVTRMGDDLGSQDSTTANLRSEPVRVAHPRQPARKQRREPAQATKRERTADRSHLRSPSEPRKSRGSHAPPGRPRSTGFRADCVA